MGEASFTDVWEAHAFCYGGGALQKGMMFAWSKWSAMLGEEIKRAQAASDPVLVALLLAEGGGTQPTSESETSE